MSPCGDARNEKEVETHPPRQCRMSEFLFKTVLFFFVFFLHLDAEQCRPGQTSEERRDVHPGLFPYQVLLVRVSLQKVVGNTCKCTNQHHDNQSIQSVTITYIEKQHTVAIEFKMIIKLLDVWIK